MKRIRFFLLLFIVAMASCKKDNGHVQMFTGTSVNIGNGSAYSFITVDKNNKPETIGIRMNADALAGLPTEGDPGMGGEVPGYVLPLPSAANGSGYDHCEVDWNPHGHEPSFAYGVPHFDFHFYMITPQEQSEVVAGPDTVATSPQYIPQDFISGVMAVPDMGTHWVDTTSAEFHGQPFTITFIYGFYHGNMTFLEPMISKDFLQTKPDVTLPIKQPQAFQKHGYYPARMHLHFDNKQKEYVLALEGLSYQ